MPERLERWALYGLAAVAAFVVLPAVFLFLQGACGGSSSPSAADSKAIRVSFRNNADENIHLVFPGEAGDDSNRVTPGQTRPTITTIATYKPGNSIAFRALRNGVLITSRNCTVTRAVYDGAVMVVAFDDSPVRIDCGTG